LTVEINAATDPAQKLALFEKFAAGPGSEGDNPSWVDGLYGRLLYMSKRNGQGEEYGDKIFAPRSESFQNAMNISCGLRKRRFRAGFVGYGERRRES